MVRKKLWLQPTMHDCGKRQTLFIYHANEIRGRTISLQKSLTNRLN